MSIEQGFRPELMEDPAFRAMADAMPVHFAVTDERGRIVFCNRSYVEFSGRTIEEHIAHGWRYAVHAADRDRVEQVTRAAFAARAPLEVEARFRAADGTFCWLQTRGSPYYGPGGQFAGYVGTGIDTSARHEAAAERDRALGLLDAIDDASPVGIAFIDSGMRIRRANRAFRELLRLGDRAILGLTPTEIGPPDWGESTEAILRGVLESGEAIRDLEFRAERRNVPGAFRNWLANIFPVRNGSGIAGIGIVLQDTTTLKAHEEAHRLDVARYKTLTDTLPEIVWTATPDGQISFVNERWPQYSGRGATESLGSGWIESVHPDDMAATVERWQSALVSGELYEAEFRIRRADGHYRWHMTRALPVRDGEGRIREWSGTCTDIHGMRMSQARYRLLADALPQIVGTATANGQFNYFNRWFYDYTGMTTATFIDDRWTSSIHADDVGDVRRRWRAAVRSGRPFEGQMRIRRHDGVYRWHLSRAVPITEPASERVIAWFATSTDIDDIRFERQRYQTLAGSLPELVWTLNAEGRLTYVNRRTEEYTGESLQELAATDWAGVVHPDDEAAARANLARALTDGEPYAVEYRLRRRDGEYRWHIARGVPLRDSAGEVAGWVGSASDVHDLRFEQARYRTLSDTVRELIWSAAPDGKVTYANLRFWEYFGIEPGDWSLETWRATVHPDDLAEAWRLYSGAMATGHPFEFEYRLRRYDGEQRWHVAQGVPLFDESGVVSGWICSASDIHRRKAAEKQVVDLNKVLERRLADMETLLRVLPIGVGIAHDRDCREIGVNRALAEMLGIEPTANASLYDVGSPRPYELYRGGRRMVHSEYSMYQAANGDGSPVKDEYDVVRRDGESRHLLAYAAPLMDGNVVRGAVGAFVDLTEMKHAQDEIFRTTALYTAASDAIPFGGWSTDAEGKPSYTSESFLRLIGASSDEEVAVRFEHALAPAERHEVRAAWEATFARRGLWDREMELEGVEGEHCWVLSRGQPAYDVDGEFRGYAGINLDITGLKSVQAELATAVEYLRRANDTKDELLGLVSHELRTPLTAIIGNAQSLRRHASIPRAQRKRALHDIEDEGNRLHRLIENMLLLARVEAAEEFEPEPVLLQRALPRLIALVKQRLPGVQIDLRIDNALPPASAEPGYIEQIVNNLVGNAVKYSGGTRPVDISVEREGAFLRVAVEDRGSGITEEEAEQIFTPFFRAERTAENAGGIGLGLAVCRRLVELQRGRIWAAPRSGGGTTVAFTLPIEAELLEPDD